MQSLTNNYTQLVTLPNLRIIDYVLGPPGSVHDSMAFKESCAYKESDQLFPNGEWLWADSAYGLSLTSYHSPWYPLTASSTITSQWYEHVIIDIHEF